MGIFDRRLAFKPFEYPDVLQYKDAIRHSYWIHTEWNFTSDIHDFKRLSPIEQGAVKNALLAISQVEVAVKKFWTNLGDRFPKSEFEQVGVTFGESEVRHADAYSHLLEVLGFNREFDSILENQAIRGRVGYLSKHLARSAEVSDREFTFTLALFSLFVEYISLFSQFVIIKSFNNYLNILKDIDNVVQATQREEQIHAMFGVALISHIRREHPDFFDDGFYWGLRSACESAFIAESSIVDWIFENGELEFLPKSLVIEFVKNRFNESLEMVGGQRLFEVDREQLKKLSWFNDELYSEVNTDFFYKKPVTYSKKTQAITAEELF